MFHIHEIKRNIQTEKEDQAGPAGADHEAQQHATEGNYYDEGPSIMPGAENYAGNQENWGASAETWLATGPETTEWTASNPTPAGVARPW